MFAENVLDARHRRIAVGIKAHHQDGGGIGSTHQSPAVRPIHAQTINGGQPAALETGRHPEPIDKLVRALIAVILFEAAYLAEVVRGGLQAIPKGQYEATHALGLSYWQSMGLVILPQALRLVIPGIVNTFIALFKDTSLVIIIGLADFFTAVHRATVDPEWLGFSTEGYVFAAFVYFLFCFGMSRYSIALEKRLARSEKR